MLVYWGVYPFWLGCKFLEEYGEEKVSKVYNGVEIIRGYDGDVRLWEKVIGQKPVFTKSLCVLLYYVYRRLGVLL